MIENEHAQAPNPYKGWQKENAKQFKNVYERRTPDISFKEAAILVEAIRHELIKNRAKLMLYSGLRYFECDYIDGPRVLGKGAKYRTFFPPEEIGQIYRGPYKRFYMELRKVGLKPHMLRKLFATECHRQGLDHFDLCKVMGWASIETAKSYIAPKNDSELMLKIREIRK